jgi:type IV secretory pathway VirB10-like protein
MMTKRKRTAKSAAAPPKTPVKAKKPKKAKKEQRYAARRHPQTEAEREERRVLHERSMTFHRMDDHGRIALFELVRKGIVGHKAVEVALTIGDAVEAERAKRVPPEYDHESDDDAVLHVSSQFDNADEIVDELLRASMQNYLLHPSGPKDPWLRETAKDVWDAAILYAELMEAKRPPRRAGILTRRIL